MNIVQNVNFTKSTLPKLHTGTHIKTVLIVEHDASLRFLLQRAIQKSHCATICVNSYPDILDVLAQEKIDLVLIDINTNHWEDFNILQTIRQQFDIPIVAVSAHSPTVAQKRANRQNI